ncbi:MAG: DUF421 domain-containing protein [Burkholderiales bacterium]|nr:DUF421 domain-containing protein [Burkholderiales bacterium]
MDAVVRALAIYALLIVVFRIAGQRAIAQITTFDFVLLLVIGEATQQALLGDDFSITHAAIVIVTLVGLDIVLGEAKTRWRGLRTLLDGGPVILVEDGRPIAHRMRRARVDASDILSAARVKHGLRRMEDVRYAVLEASGDIAIIPRDGAGG